jgi:phosphatidylglycerol:prolipoprotein diacylglycerol transferase
MRQTLFYVPESIGGVPLFGFGALLLLWGIGTGVWLLRRLWKHGWDREIANQLPTFLITGALIAFVLPAVSIPGHGLPIRGYGVFMVLALAASMWLALHFASHAGITGETIFSLAVWLCVGGFVGARVFYVIEYWPVLSEVRTTWELMGNILNFTQGGLVVFGALLGAAAAFVAFVRTHRLDGLALADVIAPSLALGQGIGRIGCLMSGCCFGGPTDLPWGIFFPFGAPAHVRQVESRQVFLHGIRFAASDGKEVKRKGTEPARVASVAAGSSAEGAGLKPGDEIVAVNGQPLATARDAELLLLGLSGGVHDRISVSVAGDPQPHEWSVESPTAYMRPVHPTQIYSSIDALLLCLFLCAYYPYGRREGEVIAWLLTIHPVTRFLLEAIRIDEPSVFGLGMSISQVLSLGLLAAAGGLWWYIRYSRPGQSEVRPSTTATAAAP